MSWELHRDPICGTFVSTYTAFQRQDALYSATTVARNLPIAARARLALGQLRLRAGKTGRRLIEQWIRLSFTLGELAENLDASWSAIHRSALPGCPPWKRRVPRCHFFLANLKYYSS